MDKTGIDITRDTTRSSRQLCNTSTVSDGSLKAARRFYMYCTVGHMTISPSPGILFVSLSLHIYIYTICCCSCFYRYVHACTGLPLSPHFVIRGGDDVHLFDVLRLLLIESNKTSIYKSRLPCEAPSVVQSANATVNCLIAIRYRVTCCASISSNRGPFSHVLSFAARSTTILDRYRGVSVRRGRGRRRCKTMY